MRRRDWAGTVLVACLIAAAGLLHNHTVLLVALAVVAAACVAVIVVDVRGAPRRFRLSRKTGGGYLVGRSEDSLRGAIGTAEVMGNRLREIDEANEKQDRDP